MATKSYSDLQMAVIILFEWTMVSVLRGCVMLLIGWKNRTRNHDHFVGRATHSTVVTVETENATSPLIFNEDPFF